MVATAENVVVVIGTPVDEHLNPDPDGPSRGRWRRVQPFFRDGQLLVLRSTVFPGVTALVERMVAGLGVDIDVAFCPERIAEHKAMEELFSLPQIVSARTDDGLKRAGALVRQADRRDRRAGAGGGRTREAVHQHVALHQVRRGEPVLHDGE